MADADIRDALLAIADADAGGLLAPELYTDIAGFVRLDRFAGNMDLAMGTILAIVRSAARQRRENPGQVLGLLPPGDRRGPPWLIPTIPWRRLSLTRRSSVVY